MLLQSVDIKDPSKIAIIKHGGYIEHIKHRYTKNEAKRELGLNEEERYIVTPEKPKHLPKIGTFEAI